MQPKDYLNEVRVIESERTDGLPLVAFAYSEGVRRKAELRSPQRGKEDAQAIIPYPFGIKSKEDAPPKVIL